ncbi:MAG: hypothetical protein WCF83_05025 [Pseudolabrys sp.]
MDKKIFQMDISDGIFQMAFGLFQNIPDGYSRWLFQNIPDGFWALPQYYNDAVPL